MKRKKQINSLKSYFNGLFFVIILLFLVATSNNKNVIAITNINTIKAIESSRLEKFEREEKLESEYIKVNSVLEIEAKKNKRIEFTGTLTGYGPDCEGCSGIVGCSPYQNVKNGNIYYEDQTYGKIRILAADKKIPCGSIIKISNYSFIEGEFYGIVLDRGSAINGLTMDLLYKSEQDTIKIGRTYNINFKIERWGF